jgi:hypothetical protein
VPVEIFVGLPVFAPANFRLKTPDPKIRPFYIMLNWDTPLGSGIVDRWEIERVVVNNLAAAKINIKNPNDFLSLGFAPFRMVYRESSRFRSLVVDSPTIDSRYKIAGKSPVPRKDGQTITGQHHFMDGEVIFGNSYFYRIRAVDTNSVVSDWTYKGMKLTEEIFEKKVAVFVSQPEMAKAVIKTAPAIPPRVFVKPTRPSTLGLTGAAPGSPLVQLYKLLGKRIAVLSEDSLTSKEYGYRASIFASMSSMAAARKLR